MTGENLNMRQEITENTGPIPSLVTESGKIVAIIDADNYVRLLQMGEHFVLINQCNSNHVVGLSRPEILEMGIPYNQKVPNDNNLFLNREAMRYIN